MISETYRVNHGGLMRCCLLTLDDEMLRRQRARESLMHEGDVLRCQYCHDEYGMVCNTETYDGVLSWHWAKPLPTSIKAGNSQPKEDTTEN
jgi:hypothetical protein